MFVIFYSCIVRWNHIDPIIHMLLLARVVVGIEVSFVLIVLQIHLSFTVNVVMHFNTGESISQLLVVVEWDCREGVECIWVHSFCYWHSSLVSDGLGRSWSGRIGAI